MVAPGVPAQHHERLIHIKLTVLGQHALGLFDHDPAVERELQPLVDAGTVPYRALLQHSDGRDFGERLLVQRARGAAIQVKGPDAGRSDIEGEREKRGGGGFPDRGVEYRPRCDRPSVPKIGNQYGAA